LGEREPHESKLYADFPHLYDRIFQRIFYSDLEFAIRSLDIQKGQRILEVGVGTGISLPAYPKHCKVVGIDLAQGMLLRAKGKIQTNRWSHAEILGMDALDMCFRRDSFDHVMAFHVVTVVPDPVRMMREVGRVCKPNGTIVIVNHFRSEKPFLGIFEDLIDPVTTKLGWRSTLRLSRLISQANLNVEKVTKCSKRSLYDVVFIRNSKNGRSHQATKDQSDVSLATYGPLRGCL
jgi:phosphatidylethanolamine/phosphatidyl-N-methylethanolamine N-methyltransferase